ncbi:hypothetical protein ACFXTN_012909 [Malus domestica]
MKSSDPIEKDMVARKKEERIVDAEINKRSTGLVLSNNNQPVMPWSKTRQLDRMRQGLPAKLQPVLALVPTHVGTARPRHRSACMPSDGGCGGAHPIGINTGTGRTTAHNTHVGGNAPNYGTGGTCN